MKPVARALLPGVLLMSVTVTAYVVHANERQTNTLEAQMAAIAASDDGRVGAAALLLETHERDPRDTATPNAAVDLMIKVLGGGGLSPANQGRLRKWLTESPTGASRITIIARITKAAYDYWTR